MTRRRGDGSIYFDEKRKLWVAAVSMGTGPNGRRVRRRLYAPDATTARRRLRAAIAKQARKELVAGRSPTVRLFLEQWILNAVKPRLRYSTLRFYVLLLGQHVIPALGSIRLEDLRADQVEAMLAAERERGLSARTVHHIRAVLRAALNHARRQRLVTFNAAADARVATPGRPNLRILSPAQARHFLDFVRPDRLCALYVLALHCGLRQGELLGLRWEDVDLEGGKLTVRFALQRIRGVLQLVDLKSASSYREVALSMPVVDAFRTHQRRQHAERLSSGPRWIDGDYVFASPRGAPLDGSGVSKGFRRALAAAGLDGLRFHDLRHSCTSFLLAQGYDPRTVADMLGHSQVRLTLEAYAHSLPARRREAADAMGRLLALPSAPPLATIRADQQG
jgi:integrase